MAGKIHQLRREIVEVLFHSDNLLAVLLMTTVIVPNPGVTSASGVITEARK